MLTEFRGFKIARLISIRHPSSVMALFTSIASPASSPTFSSLLSHHLNRLTNHRLSGFNAPSSLSLNAIDTPSGLASLTTHPQTSAYAVCDSPAGLLAAVLDHIHTTGQLHLWTPTDLLTWTMLLWLPGPEAPLRWLRAVHTGEDIHTEDTTWSNVPLGVHVYHAMDTTQEQRQHWSGQGVWAKIGALVGDRRDRIGLEDVHRVVWVRRSTGSIGIPARDASSDIILDLRQFCAAGKREDWLVEKEKKKGCGEDEHGPPAVEEGPQKHGGWKWVWTLRKEKTTDEENPPTTPATPVTMIATADRQGGQSDDKMATMSYNVFRRLWSPRKEARNESSVTYNGSRPPNEPVNTSGLKESSNEGLGVNIDQPASQKGESNQQDGAELIKIEEQATPSRPLWTRLLQWNSSTEKDRDDGQATSSRRLVWRWPLAMA
jgi:hypothetical protein